ncbi:hypothetical protein EYF80_002809 [Liparis tanakae]|uniref:Uncharacterized protein n=1 Tax=Liparis tanakae TaxID=230148 RepID=A0A4Z2JB43_9TELE|nr:hypothetical protein EYF80_002809 [Liparis tanakae]
MDVMIGEALETQSRINIIQHYRWAWPRVIRRVETPEVISSIGNTWAFCASAAFKRPSGLRSSLSILRPSVAVCRRVGRLTCLRAQEAAGSAEALTQGLSFWFELRAQRHRQAVVEVDRMSLTLGQTGQAAARRLQALLLQDLADAGVHA